MNVEVFAVSAEKLQGLEEFSADSAVVLCVLGSLFYCAARQLEHIRVMHEME